MNPEYSVSKNDQIKSERESVLRELNPDINNFLFSRVPGGLTIDEFEQLSTEVYTLINIVWEKFI
jgi:hypothetical protein